jgi:hypothetical protein
VLNGTTDPNQIETRVSSARVAAGVEQFHVASVPGLVTRIGTTDYSEYSYATRLMNISLKELSQFLQQLSANDPGAQIKSIELSSPENLIGLQTGKNPVPTGIGEPWTADVTISYVMYLPREREKSAKSGAD